MLTFPFLALRQRLLATIPELKEVAFYTGQDQEKGALRVAPAVYIRFLDTNTISLGEGIQEANLEFELLLLSDCLREGDERIYPPIGTLELSHLELGNQIHRYISGHGARLSDLPDFVGTLGTPDDFVILGTCDRRGYAHQHDNKAIMKTTQRFRTYIKDYTGAKKYSKAIATLELLEIGFV